MQRNTEACLGCDLCNGAGPMAIPVNARTRVTDSSCISCLERVGACPSQDGLTVTLALPTFVCRSKAAVEADRYSSTPVDNLR